MLKKYLGLLAAFALHCDSSQAPSPSTEAASPLEESSFTAELARALCEGTAPCCTVLKRENNANCEKDALDGTDGLGSLFGSLRSAGAPYDGQKARQCVQETRAIIARQIKACEAGTGAPDELPTSCREVYQGPLSLGEGCGSDFHCNQPPGTDVRCKSSSSGRRCLETVYQGEGETCVGSETQVLLCKPGLMCSDTDATCQRAPLGGEPCIQGRCGDGFFCATDGADQSGICTPNLEEGAPCQPYQFRCKEGFGCNPDNLRCEPERPARAACTIPEQCVSRNCQPDLGCYPENILISDNLACKEEGDGGSGPQDLPPAPAAGGGGAP
jgi:hypothetical protein